MSHPFRVSNLFLPLVLPGAILLIVSFHPASAQTLPKDGWSAFPEFVSFTLNSGSMVGSSALTIKSGKAIVSSQMRRGGEAAQKRTAWKLSAQETAKFLRLLKEANYPALKPEYRESGVMDAGFSSSVLTLKDKNGNTRSYAVTVYGGGGQASKAYYKFAAYLRELESEKLTPISK